MKTYLFGETIGARRNVRGFGQRFRASRTQIFQQILSHDFVRKHIQLRVGVAFVRGKIVEVGCQRHQIGLQNGVVLHAIIESPKLQIFDCDSNEMK